jgi:hypothetical protein
VKTAVKAKSRLSKFTITPPTPGFLNFSGTGGGPPTRQIGYFHLMGVLKLIESKHETKEQQQME